MIDLKSDTVTKPTPAMLEAIMNAEVGDDVYKEDPTVNLLESRLAEMFGKDQALFFPSGSMANQAAIKLHTQPGEQLICDKWAHVYNYEGGGASFNSGVSCKLVDGNRGMITAAQVAENINPPDFYHSPLTSLVCLENTTNKGGGACYDFEEIQAIRKVCDEHQLGLHLDGARLFNALVAKGESPKQYGEVFDTISVCLSKGLGTPMGSVLIGDEKLMKNAMRVRKVLGGGMRQIGFMAAAGLYALENNVERLAEDHQRAQELATTLAAQAYVKQVEPVETNIIIFYLNDGINEVDFLKRLEDRGVIISGMGQGKLRIVTHLGYTQPMHEELMEILKGLV
ncbi:MULTISPECIES: threonine aldolase family protein [Mesonia]|uniref:L-allo-threonine aldolase n=1 Tax=Mesonia oceanica TaxID=2687242 RepID=A0AC61Y744_9FLAO|nr:MULTISPECIES: GntG family PLP-dependent aldolase [Mesonia]MAN26780.1 threonine aldolase [Mesonia sp.]MAQ40483.1 threonine aldolase [Mesonia sp.]MBJ98105.1 threonine aldolase [Flavobacteriaceae bacterium]VVV00322.1 L-allo-threonine aldolase [Mesonia oceanica]|tara:strand:- start:3121 stop:4140 length:1020 start_codon:yes stop_codon:yes gene_type:complete